MKKILYPLLLFVVAFNYAQINPKVYKKLTRKYYVSKFNNGYAIIQHKRKYTKGLANKEGKILIKPQYYFLRGISKCNTLLASNTKIYRPNDGGGRGIKGFKDIKLISTKNELIKNLDGIKIVFVFGKDLSPKYDHIFNFVDQSGKMGLINDCGKIIVPAKYQHINQFNTKGQAVVFNGNSIQVIDTLGIEILKKPLAYDVDYDSFFSIPAPGELCYLYVKNDKLICKKNNLYGIIDIKNNKTFVPFKYDRISPLLKIFGQDTLGYIVQKDQKMTVVDHKSGKEILPLVFETITGISKINQGSYIKGYLSVQENGKESLKSNYFDLEKQKFLFPKEMSVKNAIPLNYHNLIVKTTIHRPSGDYDANGIYNTKKNTFLIDYLAVRDVELLKISNRFILLKNRRKKTAEIFDLLNEKITVKFNQIPTIQQIGGMEFYKVSFQNREILQNGIIASHYTYSFYSKDFKPLIENIKPFKKFEYMDHKLTVYSGPPSNRIKRVFDINGNLVYEKRLK